MSIVATEADLFTKELFPSVHKSLSPLHCLVYLIRMVSRLARTIQAFILILLPKMYLYCYYFSFYLYSTKSKYFFLYHTPDHYLSEQEASSYFSELASES